MCLALPVCKCKVCSKRPGFARTPFSPLIIHPDPELVDIAHHESEDEDADDPTTVGHNDWWTKRSPAMKSCRKARTRMVAETSKTTKYVAAKMMSRLRDTFSLRFARRKRRVGKVARTLRPPRPGRLPPSHH